MNNIMRKFETIFIYFSFLAFINSLMPTICLGLSQNAGNALECESHSMLFDSMLR